MNRLLSFAIFLLTLACLAPATAMQVDDSYSRVDMAQVVDILVDPSGELTLAQVQSPDLAQSYVRWRDARSSINFGYSSAAYWLRFSLNRKREGTARWILEIPYGQLNKVFFYAPDAPAIKTGSDFPLASRPLASRYWAFEVTPEEQEKVFYLRVVSNNPVSIPITLWRSSTYLTHLRDTTALQWLYYGSLLALLVYNLFLFSSLRDRRFLLYSAYGLALGLAMFAGNGYGQLFLWPDWPRFDAMAQSVFLGLAASLAGLFTLNFLPTERDAPLLARFIRINSGILPSISLGLIWSLILPMPLVALNMALIVAALLSGLMTLIACWKARREMNRAIHFFMAGWAALWLGAFVAGGRAFGLLATNPVTAYSLQIGSAFEMLLLALALSEIVRLERSGRERAQAQALKAEAELVSALKNNESRLEREVQERTAELEIHLDKEKRLLDQYVRFGSMIAHEFRNPLGIVQSQLGLMRQEHATGQDRLETRVGIIAGAVQRLTRMFDKWLQSDELSHSLDEMVPNPIPLEAWVRNFCESNSYLANGHQLGFHFDPRATEVMADEYLLEMAVFNLFENAVKYSEHGRQIKLATHVKPGYVGISVSDQGCGIPETLKAEVFSDFFRAPQSGSIPGLGLGLVIVRRIVDAHGGHLQLDSEPGCGSTFYIWLPVCHVLSNLP